MNTRQPLSVAKQGRHLGVGRQEGSFLPEFVGKNVLGYVSD